MERIWNRPITHETKRDSYHLFSLTNAERDTSGKQAYTQLMRGDVIKTKSHVERSSDTWNEYFSRCRGVSSGYSKKNKFDFSDSL